jgi:hypothetical protein
MSYQRNPHGHLLQNPNLRSMITRSSLHPNSGLHHLHRTLNQALGHHPLPLTARKSPSLSATCPPALPPKRCTSGYSELFKPICLSNLSLSATKNILAL